MKRLLTIVVIGFVLGSTLASQAFRGTPSQIRVNVDANGYLSASSAAQTLPVTRVQFSNANLAVDSSGNLLVNCIGCTGTGTINGTIANTQVAFGCGADEICGSSKFIWDNTNAQIKFSVYSELFPSIGMYLRNTDFSTYIGWDGTPNLYFGVPLGESFSFDGGGIAINGALNSGVNRLGIYANASSSNSASQILSGGSLTATVTHVIDKVQGIGGDINITSGSANNGYNFHGLTTISGSADIIETQWGTRVGLILNDTSTAGNYFGYEGSITKASGASLGHGYIFWSGNMFGRATGSSYPLWYDGGGSNCNESAVTRINQFGIYAYYNPCFAAYIPDAVDFEREIIRWGDTGVFGTDNIGYVGLESGGTGTLRSLVIMGNTVSFETIPGTKAPVTALTFQPTSQYKSVDGTNGATTTCTLLSITAITVKNGLVTGCS